MQIVSYEDAKLQGIGGYKWLMTTEIKTSRDIQRLTDANQIMCI